MRHRLRALLRGSLVALAFALVLLLVLEGLVRWRAPQRLETRTLAGGSLVAEQAGIDFGNRPGAVVRQQSPEFEAVYVINEEGLRDRALQAVPRVPGRLRVVLLGDSFTFGIGSDYEETWAAAFERELAERGMAATVLNAGVPGYDTRREVDFLTNHWDRLAPDVVVLTFLPNDLFSGDSGEAVAPVVAAAEAKKPPLHVVALLQRWLLQFDALYVSVYQRTGRAAYFAATPSAEVDAEAERTAGLLDAAAAFCAARGVPLIVLSIPQQFQVLLEAKGEPPADLDVRRLDRVLASAAHDSGFRHVAALDTLVHAYRRLGRDLYYRHDGHLTPAGNQVVGQFLAGRFAAIMEGEARAHSSP